MNIKSIKNNYRKYLNFGTVEQVEFFSFHKEIYYLDLKGNHILTKELPILGKCRASIFLMNILFMVQK